MQKTPQAYRTIGEVSLITGEPQYVLRFWETRIKHIAPIKRKSGRRYYPPKIVKLVIAIQRMLRHEGLTIKGVQKRLNQKSIESLIDNITLPDPQSETVVNTTTKPVVKTNSDEQHGNFIRTINTNTPSEDDMLQAIRQLIGIHQELEKLCSNTPHNRTNTDEELSNKIA